jgi:hypothetical protein
MIIGERLSAGSNLPDAADDGSHGGGSHDRLRPGADAFRLGVLPGRVLQTDWLDQAIALDRLR